MKTKTNLRSKWLGIFFVVTLVALAMSTTVFGGEAEAEYVSNMYATAWSLVPPLVAIILALITKEVYSSLFIGIVVGGLFYANFDPKLAYLTIFTNDTDGGMLAKLSDGWNVGILIFLVVLGIIVALMNKAGGSAAYGRWAASTFKTRRSAMLGTSLLGCLIFVDDYFNCLTVGSVMRPVTDTHKVSRAKLAYLIDATAAPICIIAPISSWAAAVAGVVEGVNGLDLFIRAIPYNFYALLTIVMMIVLVVSKTEYGPMRQHELNALKGDLHTTPAGTADKFDEVVAGNPKGKVVDLILPVVSLIVFCIIGMIYTGGFFDGVGIIEAFSGCDASVGLAYGSFFGLAFTIVFYMVRKVLSFKECMASLPEGFKAMVPAILILTMAWSLKSMTDSLGAAPYVEALVRNSASALMNFLPAIIFLVACVLAFASGTSWGTFGILIPIVVEAFAGNETMMIIAISACMAGAVCGDHCSPISDTTIMASAGAQSNHINHVNTQLPYAITVAAVSFVTYIVAGFVKTAWISLPVGIVLMVATILVIKKKNGAVEA